jgi:hypothetical protein
MSSLAQRLDILVQKKHPLTSRVGLTLINPAVWSWSLLGCLLWAKLCVRSRSPEALQEQSESYDGDTETRTGWGGSSHR